MHHASQHILDITPLAQAQPGPGGGIFGMLLPLLLFFGAMWFLIIAPQRKRQKEHQRMIESLKAGDEIVTNGGICGTILAVKNDRISMRTAENTKIEIAKSFINSRSAAKE